MGPANELQTQDRFKAIGMQEAGLSIRAIARRLECHPSTISRLFKKVAETGTVCDRPRSGRHKKTTEEEDRRLVAQHEADPWRKTKTSAIGLHISTQSVRRRLKSAGLKCRRPHIGIPFKENHRVARLQWANARIRWFAPRWGRVLFSDESRFKVSFADGRARI